MLMKYRKPFLLQPLRPSAVLIPIASAASPMASFAMSVATQPAAPHDASRRLLLGPFFAPYLLRHRSMATGVATPAAKRLNLGPVKASSGETDLSPSSSSSAAAAASDEPVSLGTVKIPDDVNLAKLEAYLYQWGTSLTQNANLPLPLPLKVDRIEGGVRLGYIRLVEGVIEDLLHIDCVVYPASPDSGAIFRALRCGRFKDQAPPGEQIIMQSLLQALKKSIQLSRA